MEQSTHNFFKNLFHNEFPENDNEISFFLDLTGDILWKDKKELFENLKNVLKKYDANTRQNDEFLCSLARTMQIFPTLKPDIVNTVYVMCLEKLG